MGFKSCRFRRAIRLSFCFDEGLTLEAPASESLNGVQVTLSIQLLRTSESGAPRKRLNSTPLSFCLIFCIKLSLFYKTSIYKYGKHDTESNRTNVKRAGGLLLVQCNANDMTSVTQRPNFADLVDRIDKKKKIDSQSLYSINKARNFTTLLSVWSDFLCSIHGNKES